MANEIPILEVSSEQMKFQFWKQVRRKLNSSFGCKFRANEIPILKISSVQMKFQFGSKFGAN